jgi:hypothetical protein
MGESKKPKNPQLAKVYTSIVDGKVETWVGIDDNPKAAIISDHFNLEGIEWNDVTLDYSKYDKIKITIMEKSKTFTAYKLGLSKKNGTQTKTGLLLLFLAECHGIDADFSLLIKRLEATKDSLKQLVVRLNKNLMELFSIKTRPIYYRKKAYATRFNVKSTYLDEIKKRKANDIISSSDLEYNDEIGQ